MVINSETWKNLGFSGIGWVSIFGFGAGLDSKKVGFLPRIFWVRNPSLLVSLTKTTFPVKTFSMENNYSILMLLTMWEKSIDLARIFLHAPLGRKIVIKKYLFSLMKILVRSFLNFISHLLCTFCRYCFWNRIQRRRFKPSLQMTVRTKF